MGTVIRTVYESSALPVGDRLAVINDGLRSTANPMQLHSPDPAEFRARVRELPLAPVQVTELSWSAGEIRRTPRLIRAGDPGHCSVILAERGSVGLSHRGRAVTLRAGGVALGDSSHPFAMRTTTGATIITAQLPVALLPLSAGRIDRLLPLHFADTTGLAALLARAMSGFVQDAGTFNPAEAPRLGSIVIDLLTAVLAHQLPTGDVPDTAGRQALLLQIEGFVSEHLADRQLTPRSIAGAHNISVSYLHRLFSERGTTVAASIRGRRLERARRDLADPVLRSTSVGRIAVRWGFADHATFTRAFRSAYATTPTEYRHDVLRPA